MRVLAARDGLSELRFRLRDVPCSGPDDFTSSAYFADVPSGSVDVEFVVEGSEPIVLSRVAAYAHPDAMRREFENGPVLANPSPRPYTFDLGALVPAAAWRRFQGTPLQDPKTNDGSAVSGKVTLSPKDALFLVRGTP